MAGCPDKDPEKKCKKHKVLRKDCKECEHSDLEVDDASVCVRRLQQYTCPRDGKNGCSIVE